MDLGAYTELWRWKHIIDVVPHISLSILNAKDTLNEDNYEQSGVELQKATACPRPQAYGEDIPLVKDGATSVPFIDLDHNEEEAP
jgi:hypothetical protein